MKSVRKNRLAVVISLFFIFSYLITGTKVAAAEKNPEELPGLYPKKQIKPPKSGIKLSGYFQGKYISDEDGSVKSPNQFKVMRARLKFTGKLHELIDYKLMLGAYEPPPSDSAKPALVDGYLDFAFCPYGSLKVGQFFMPFGFEGPRPIPNHPAIERSRVTHRQTNAGLKNGYSIFRDVGASLHGKFKLFSYDLAVMNGRGSALTDTNSNELTSDDNKMKDFLSTIRYTPCKNVMVGSSWHRGFISADAMSRNRFSAFLSGSIQDLRIMAEYITKIDQRLHTSDLRSQGAYILLAYRYKKKYEPIIRGEVFDPDLSKNGNLLNILTLGINYFPWNDVRLAVNYEIKDNRDKSGADNLFQALAQISF
ncbi:MAG: porin [bacterium]